MTDEELKALVASLATAQKETERLSQETERRFQETDRYLKELGRQLGDLGNKFGSFTEGMALPSMTRVLQQKFGMEFISPRALRSHGGEEIEIDVLGYANSKTNRVCVVEVKSHLKDDGVDQLEETLRRFFHFFPEHKGKSLIGILAAVDAPKSVAQRVMKEGIYLARIHDDVFTLTTPKGFKPRDFSKTAA